MNCVSMIWVSQLLLYHSSQFIYLQSSRTVFVLNDKNACITLLIIQLLILRYTKWYKLLNMNKQRELTP